MIGPREALELVDTFKAAMSALTARANKLTEDYRSRIARERLRHQALLQEQHKTAAGNVAAVDEKFKALKAAAEETFRRRKSWIGKAFQNSKEQRLRQIEDRAGGMKYTLQKTMLQAERDRDAALAAAAAQRKDFQARLAAEQENLSHLEHEAMESMTGYRGLQRGFLQAYQEQKAKTEGDEEALLALMRERMSDGRTAIKRLRGHVLLSVFRHLPLWIALAVCVGCAPFLERVGIPVYPLKTGAAIGGGILVAAILFRLLGLGQARSTMTRVNQALAEARQLHDAAGGASENHFHRDTDRAQKAYGSALESSEERLKNALGEAGEQRVAARMRNDEKAVRAGQTNERLHQARLDLLEKQLAQALALAKKSGEDESASLTLAGTGKQNKLEAELEASRQALEKEWQATLSPIYAKLQCHTEEARHFFPPWQEVDIEGWKPPSHFAGAARFGTLALEVDRLCEGLPKDKRLVLPGPEHLSLPLTLLFPGEGSLLIETTDSGHDEAVNSLNDVILRLFATSPPGRVAFTILDPVGLGQNFAGVMHMADYEEQIITNRIWTQSGQIEQRLADLNEHIEKVIQMYLRNEYATIAEYNEQAGVIAEKYHFLVVADFPANFTDVAAKRLMSIAASGARCGVFMLVHWDKRLPLPQDFIPNELRKSSFSLEIKGGEPLPDGKPKPGAKIDLENPLPPEAAIRFVHQVGLQSRDSSRVEVPFEHVAPADGELWTLETTSELRVPIGRTGATKLQYLAMGKGTCQHGLIAGKTGSGKSTLFHVIITNLSMWCSPEQVEFYLVDFKKGVEFKAYATHRLPHARVVAIESDREFGLSVLQRVDDELRRRGDLFRKLGVQDLPGYKRAGGTEKIPRTLLIVDEFQEFFVEDDKISQSSSLLLDRIVRQGRAFGIHVLLGSQTLGGAYTVARTTLGQMVIRIALQCNEADAYLIMDDSNPAPRLLSRPGEGIYNDTAGSVEGNSPFQVVWLPDQTREESLVKVQAKAKMECWDGEGPVVFEGNAPADVRENTALRRQLEAQAFTPAAAGRMWLGAPNSIKGPTEAVFKRQSGTNLLVVGQNEEAMVAMLGIGLVSLASQHSVDDARFILLDSTPPGTSHRLFLDRIVQALPHQVREVKQPDLSSVMTELAGEMKARSEAPDPEAAPAIYFFINNLQRFNRLRYEEDFSFSTEETATTANPGAVLNNLVTEGTRLGIHLIVTCDTYNNASRYLSRKAISEFELRVLFQMSANDSAALIDNPKAGMLGLHRALFNNAQEGNLETFRPYALPDTAWIEYVGENLSRLLTPAAREHQS